MHLHILGICGTFMGSLALLARELGHTVSGSDENVYPPMSTQLEQQGISLDVGYTADFLAADPDLVIVGNAMSRGNPAVEALLESSIAYCSGPEWLRSNVLRGRWVLAVAGTHGKTTTSSMLAHILESAGLNPGFLIGGVVEDFSISARLGGGKYFVIEADEYDSAFFDKRSKFVHYLPRTLVLNNLEFDHADIFADLAAIQTQFHHVVRTVPASGRIMFPANVPALEQVIQKGCWSDQERLSVGDHGAVGARWSIAAVDAAKGEWQLRDQQTTQQASLTWYHDGDHNAANALAAVAAANHVGVELQASVSALSSFRGVKRRMEQLYQRGGVTVFDDFAHHPTAIRLTLEGLRRKSPSECIVAVIEPRSNTMRMGAHADALQPSVTAADVVFWYKAPGVVWDTDFLEHDAPNTVHVGSDVRWIVQQIVQQSLSETKAGVSIVLMSNGGFDGLREQLLIALNENGEEQGSD